MLLTMSLVAMTTAFQIRPQGRAVSFGVALKGMVDDTKIKDAAEHFGKYSLEEIQEMKEGKETFERLKKWIVLVVKNLTISFCPVF